MKKNCSSTRFTSRQRTATTPRPGPACSTCLVARNGTRGRSRRVCRSATRRHSTSGPC
ncbi:uncharacterized protein COLE_00491 [Cutaneotrichosporon oleaginosum]|uniref:uncharacterized protein n=1 Tax=Cutaneotrichosporon oleaginosum TaxID=879819 RepID=UPI001325212B|nr:hypothetical protein COLE_00491 [Cutaneotrichosporon oleaginosum]